MYSAVTDPSLMVGEAIIYVAAVALLTQQAT